MNKALIVASILFLSFSSIRSECGKESTSRFACLAQSTSTTTCCFKPNTCEDKSKIDSTLLDDYDCGAIEEKGETYKEYEFTQYRPQQKEIALSLEPCGETNPDKKDDCTDYSTIMNSCCKFTDENHTITGCYYIGKKFSGSSGKHIFQDKIDGNYITFTYQCSSSLLFFAKASLLLFLILF